MSARTSVPEASTSPSDRLEFVDGLRGFALLAAGPGASIVVPALVAGARAGLASGTDAGRELDATALAAFSEGGYGEFLRANWRYDWHLMLSVGQIAYQVAMFGRLLLGLWAARFLDVGRLAAHRTLLRRVAIVGALAGLVGNTVATRPRGARPRGAANLLAGGAGLGAFVRRFLVESGYLGFTLAYASGLALLFQAARWRSGLRALVPMGRMALTWYLLQTVSGIWMFDGFAPGPDSWGRWARPRSRRSRSQGSRPRPRSRTPGWAGSGWLPRNGSGARSPTAAPSRSAPPPDRSYPGSAGRRE